MMREINKSANNNKFKDIEIQPSGSIYFIW